MKVIKIVILTLLISFLLFIASVYIIFKYILTPERIKNYARSYIERTIDEQIEKYKTEMLDKISFSSFTGDKNPKQEKLKKNIENFNITENFPDVNLLSSKFTNIDILGKIDDVNMLASKMFNSANMKMESLKYKITEYFENKDAQEE